MVRLAISCEGPTEREFVKKVLAPHLQDNNIYAQPIDIGGSVSLPRIRGEVRRLVPCFDATTTLYDLYGFQRRQGKSAEELEVEIAALVGNDKRLIPYIQQHEFEALIYAAPTAVATVLGNNQLVNDLGKILAGFPGPEDINDGYETCPSRRLKGIHPAYDKLLHGPQIAYEAGLETIRDVCPRFNAWLTTLENLGK